MVITVPPALRHHKLLAPGRRLNIMSPIFYRRTGHVFWSAPIVTKFDNNSLMMIHGLVTMMFDKFVTLGGLEVFANHFCYQFGEGGLRGPT